MRTKSLLHSPAGNRPSANAAGHRSTFGNFVQWYLQQMSQHAGLQMLEQRASPCRSRWTRLLADSFVKVSILRNCLLPDIVALDPGHDGAVVVYGGGEVERTVAIKHGLASLQVKGVAPTGCC